MTFIEPINVTPASPQMEDGHQPTIDELEEINIGMSDDPCPVFSSKHLSIESKKEYKMFVSENRDIFCGLMKKCQAWAHQLRCIDWLCKRIIHGQTKTKEISPEASPTNRSQS
jgi:hypothetical protein